MLARQADSRRLPPGLYPANLHLMAPNKNAVIARNNTWLLLRLMDE